MSTSKLDAIRELLKTQSEKHVIQAVWSAYQLTEEEAVRMVKQAQGIDTTVKGYPDPFLVATEWLTAEQGRATGPYFECAPSVKANNHKPHLYGYLDKRRKNTDYPFQEVLNDGFSGTLHWSTEVMFLNRNDRRNVVAESWMYQPFIDYTNENNNRVC